MNRTRRLNAGYAARCASLPLALALGAAAPEPGATPPVPALGQPAPAAGDTPAAPATPPETPAAKLPAEQTPEKPAEKSPEKPAAKAAEKATEKPAEKPAAPAETLQHLSPVETTGVLGRVVHGADGKEIGRVVNILVDQSARPRAAVIDFGGFMGIGSRKVAVNWSSLRFAPGNADKTITLELTPDQIKAAPEFKGNGSSGAAVVAPPGGAPTPPAPPEVGLTAPAKP